MRTRLHRKLPARVVLWAEEPALSLLRRLAEANGLRLKRVCSSVGEFDGDPERWPAAQLSMPAVEFLSIAVGCPVQELVSLLPSSDVSTDDPRDAVLSRRRQPRSWFGRSGSSCAVCLDQRGGAAKHRWERPHALVCEEHSVALGNGEVSDLRAVPEVVTAQRHIDDLVAATSLVSAGRRVRAAADLVESWRYWAGLQARMVERAVNARPEWTGRSRLPPVHTDLLLLPEIAAIAETFTELGDDPARFFHPDGRPTAEILLLGRRIAGRDVPARGWRWLEKAVLRARDTPLFDPYHWESDVGGAERW